MSSLSYEAIYKCSNLGQVRSKILFYSVIVVYVPPFASLNNFFNTHSMHFVLIHLLAVSYMTPLTNQKHHTWLCFTSQAESYAYCKA